MTVRMKNAGCLIGRHKFGDWIQPATEWWERVRTCRRCGETQKGVLVAGSVHRYKEVRRQV